jgi:hypothetical protein
MIIYIGQFNEEEIKRGKDKAKLKEIQKKTGLKYNHTRLVKKQGEIAAIKVWACDIENMEVKQCIK